VITGNEARPPLVSEDPSVSPVPDSHRLAVESLIRRDRMTAPLHSRCPSGRTHVERAKARDFSIWEAPTRSPEGGGASPERSLQ
jgi:hypothetical protein